LKRGFYFSNNCPEPAAHQPALRIAGFTGQGNITANVALQLRIDALNDQLGMTERCKE
jgi:hypothetical protein